MAVFDVLVHPKLTDRKTCVVIGSTRGGTSAVAGAVRSLGVFMGQSLGRNHEDPKFLGTDHDFLLEQIHNRNKHHKVWGFKAPHAIDMIDFYMEHLTNPHFIVIYRNPLAVAQSIRTRTGNSIRRGLNHVIDFYSKIDAFLDSNEAPTLLLNYEKMTEQKDVAVTGMVDFLGLDVSTDKLRKALSIIGPDSGGYVENVSDTPLIFSDASDTHLAQLSRPAKHKLVKGNLDEAGTQFTSTSKDPWFRFELGSATTELLLSFNFKSEKTSDLYAKLYLDIGTGFNEKSSYPIRLKDGENRIVVKVPRPMSRLRLDPDTRQGTTFTASEFSVSTPSDPNGYSFTQTIRDKARALGNRTKAKATP